MYDKLINSRKAFSLIELLVILPLISIILILLFNILFLTNRSFGYTSNSFQVAEEIREFTNTIQKEVNQAINADANDTIYKPDGSNSELYIYTDLDGDGIPELVRYKLENKTIYKDIKKATNNVYPLKYQNNFTGRKKVLSNVANTEIFDQIERVEDPINVIDDNNDNRRKVKMTVEIRAKEGDSPLLIDTILVVKSRAQYGD
ncbi:MAG: hypothetical protein WCZ27_08120 [Tissierellaceae bacterium]